MVKKRIIEPKLIMALPFAKTFGEHRIGVLSNMVSILLILFAGSLGFFSDSDMIGLIHIILLSLKKAYGFFFFLNSLINYIH